ncbi:hypothetical protein C8F04DRAFT_1258017 [Mycena alexandri]|uniref:Uncharacterized protein n=1 Tax=Mycena alexandri TaxID=1745969 RepID=A0AAD6SZ23_9AGAR|nr:hypothetical protein C8F04DRAFT_1258017 [Mycena alexandri]
MSAIWAPPECPVQDRISAPTGGVDVLVTIHAQPSRMSTATPTHYSDYEHAPGR